MEKVSVIIPVYNAEKYLKECVESVLNQTYKNTEIILINDGSTDASADIASKFQKEYSNVILVNTENCGVSSARNTGMENATGEYITFLDSDDLLLPNAIELLYNDLTKHSADISAGTMNGSFAEDDNSFEVWQGKDSLINSIEDCPFTYTSCAKLYRKKFIEDLRFPVGKRVHEDGYFQLLCYLKEPKMIVRKTQLYYYRPNENSASHAKFSEKFLDILDLAYEEKEMIDSKYPDLKEKTNLILVKANMSLLSNLCKDDGTYNNVAKKCIKEVIRLKHYFVPIYSSEKRFFFIVTHRLFFPFRFILQIKQKR